MILYYLKKFKYLNIYIYHYTVDSCIVVKEDITRS